MIQNNLKMERSFFWFLHGKALERLLGYIKWLPASKPQKLRDINWKICTLETKTNFVISDQKLYLQEKQIFFTFQGQLFHIESREEVIESHNFRAMISKNQTAFRP